MLLQDPAGALPMAAAVKKLGFTGTPLWFYILKEAGRHRDRKLGKVGGRLVAEVVFGLVEEDSKSYLSVDPC